MAGPDLKDYVDVATRIQRFHEKHPEGSLTSEILTDDGTRVLMKGVALAHVEGHWKRGTGHAEEIRGSTYINKTSAVENCETSAWGRALAALGFEVKNGIASKQEVEQAKAEEQRQAKPKTLGPKQVEALRTRLETADDAKVQLVMASLGKTELSELTLTEAEALVKHSRAKAAA